MKSGYQTLLRTIMIGVAALPLLQQGGCALGDNFFQNVFAAQITTLANQAVASVFDLAVRGLIG